MQISDGMKQAYVDYAQSVIVSKTSEVQTMTSLQIAEITGKQHSHVMEAIRVMEPAWQKVSQSNFRLASYTDRQGKERPCYELTKTECLYIATKFNDEARAKLVLRWEQLEKERSNQSLFNNRLIAAKWAADFLNLNEASKLLIAKQILEPLGLPMPDYVPSKGVTHSAKELLKIHGVQMSVQSFNKALAKAGIVKQHTRNGKGNSQHKWYVITQSGEKYGENFVSPQNPNQTQPHWYDNMFSELVSVAVKAIV